MEALVKKLRRFCTIYHVRFLHNQASPKNNSRVEKDLVKFEVKVIVEFGFDFKIFLYMAIDNIDCFV